MSYQVKVELVGAKELERMLKSLRTRAQKLAAQVVNQSSLRIMNEAKKLCPVDQGRLRASISMSSYQNGLTAEIGTNTGYGVFIEFGTGPRGRTGHPDRGPLPAGYAHGGPGRPVPIDVILQWMRRVGIRPKGAQKGSRAERGLAFVIARAINKRGQYARPYMYPAFFREMPRFEADLKKLGMDLERAL